VAWFFAKDVLSEPIAASHSGKLKGPLPLNSRPAIS
jgi:hypothetical protein